MQKHHIQLFEYDANE